MIPYSWFFLSPIWPSHEVYLFWQSWSSSSGNRSTDPYCPCSLTVRHTRHIQWICCHQDSMPSALPPQSISDSPCSTCPSAYDGGHAIPKRISTPECGVRSNTQLRSGSRFPRSSKAIAIFVIGNSHPMGTFNLLSGTDGCRMCSSLCCYVHRHHDGVITWYASLNGISYQISSYFWDWFTF